MDLQHLQSVLLTACLQPTALLNNTLCTATALATDSDGPSTLFKRRPARPPLQMRSRTRPCRGGRVLSRRATI